MVTLTHLYMSVHSARDWYEPQAMMVSEDAIVVCGLLMGLNALDYNVMMSGEDFDKSVSSIVEDSCELIDLVDHWVNAIDRIDCIDFVHLHQIGVIDYSQYLRDGNYVLQTQGENGDE